MPDNSVPDIGADLLMAERRGASIDDDSPGQRFLRRHPEPVAQLGQADRELAQSVPRNHAVVGEHLEPGESVVPVMVRLVENRHRQNPGPTTTTGERDLRQDVARFQPIPSAL